MSYRIISYPITYLSYRAPLAIVLDALYMPPLPNMYGKKVLELLQLWYADNCYLAGRATAVAQIMTILEKYVPLRGFFPKPSKSIAIGGPDPTTPTSFPLVGVECT